MVGWTATVAETVLGLALIVGFRTGLAAFLSGLLLLLFAIGMTVGLGILAPLSYSVFTASAGALLLAVHAWRESALTAPNAQGQGIPPATTDDVGVVPARKG